MVVPRPINIFKVMSFLFGSGYFLGFPKFKWSQSWWIDIRTACGWFSVTERWLKIVSCQRRSCTTFSCTPFSHHILCKSCSGSLLDSVEITKTQFIPIFLEKIFDFFDVELIAPVGFNDATRWSTQVCQWRREAIYSGTLLAWLMLLFILDRQSGLKDQQDRL